MISVRLIESKASPINGIGYRIVLGGATGSRPDIAVINVEQSPKKKQATISNAQCNAQSLSQYSSSRIEWTCLDSVNWSHPAKAEGEAYGERYLSGGVSGSSCQ